MDEASARQVILAEAIETADTQGQLLSAAERDQVDRQARQDAAQGDPGQGAMPPEDFVRLRAQRVLGAAGTRHPSLLLLQAPTVWAHWLPWVLPLAAFFIGVATDAVGNPHRVDLVSLPLLGIVAWNLAIYLAILLGALWPKRAGHRPWLSHVGRWSDGTHTLRRRHGSIEAQVAVRFHARWLQATHSLHIQRCKRVLHLCAAAWAAGVIASLLVRGLVVEYRVGWESTFLGPQQVFAILSVLRLPALLVAPFSAFTVEDVAQLRFSSGGGAAGGAAWVWMYVALLVTVVILPRVVLAAWAAWREYRLERRVPLDLQDAYYQRVVSLLQSTRVRLALLAQSAEDRARLLRVMTDHASALPVLLTTVFGDVLRLIEIHDVEPPPATPLDPSEGSGWLSRWRSRLGLGGTLATPGDVQRARMQEGVDLVLHVPAGCHERDGAMLRWLDKPVLEVDMGRGRGLPFESFGRCWIQDRALLDAIAQRLPQAKRSGLARIARAWEERNDEKLRLSMAAIAEHLLFAARQMQEVQAGALTVKSLLPSERQAQTSARQAAMDAIVQRLDDSASRMVASLHKLHGLDEASRDALEHRLEERFLVQQPVDAPQAGMAGAATGAAMGASLDLLAGGLTLGAAAALGALLGGGAAYMAAAWKNRATPTGATVVQLSDEMLQALLHAALLRYVAIVHWARGTADVEPAWESHVAAAVSSHQELLPGFWSGARSDSESEHLTLSLSNSLANIAKSILMHLYSM
jgi:hypothetical protein